MTTPSPVYIELNGNEWYAAEDIEHFSSVNHDFEWNYNETMFRPIALPWWDDASYIRYQSEDTGQAGYDDEDEHENATCQACAHQHLEGYDRCPLFVPDNSPPDADDIVF